MKFKRCFTILLKLVFIGFLFLSTTSIRAVGGYPFPQKIIQPDGSSLTIQMRGDEWFNWVSTSDGYRVVRNSDGLFEYATFLKSGEVEPSGVKASNPGLRDVSEKVFLSGMSRGAGVSSDVIAEIRAEKNSSLLKSSGDYYFASTGTQNLLVILANFSDTETSYEQSVFDSLMNEPGYNDTGSFADYYEEVSGGLLTMVSQVTAWVTVPNNHDYYGSEDMWTEFAYDAVEAASDLGIDFSQFDNDGDGIVEGIAVIHQGPGQEVTSDESDIWSHYYSFSSAGYSSSDRSFDGVLVDKYTLQPETRNTSGDVNTIGVICHEFGHNLGLPDFYDTEDDDVSYEGTGSWDLMNSGNYNGSPAGSTPAHHNAYSKIELGWMTEEVISTAGHLSLESSISSGLAYRVNSPEDNEYYLLENRQNTGFDEDLPGHGMIVYHVDEDVIASKWDSNDINTEEQQGLYVVAAGGVVDAASAPFPGTYNVTALTDDSDPAMVTWTGLPFNRSITSIQESSGVISFDFLALQNGSPLTLDVTNVSSYENTVYWTPSGDDDPVMLAWSDDGIFGVPEDGEDYAAGDEISGGGSVLYYGDADTLFSHTGLSASTLYYYSVWSNLGDTCWSGALTTEQLTEAETVTDFPWVQNFESDLSDWEQESLLEDYLWELRDVGVDNNPDTAANGSWFVSFYVDSYTTGSTRLVSPPLQLEADKVYNLDFYHVQVPWDDDQDYLEVYVKKDGSDTWESLTDEEEVENEWIHKRFRLPYSETMQIAFVGIGNYGYGVGLDSVIVSEGDTGETSLVGVSSVHVSDTTQTTIKLDWSLPTDESVLIVARKESKTLELPTVGVGYSANAEFGAGEALGNDEYVVYNGDGTEITVTGLENSTDYYFSFFAYADDYCYQMEPDRYIFPTESAYYNMTLELTDGVDPIGNASVTIDDTTYLTDDSGVITWQSEYNEDYKTIEIEADGYKTRWTRFYVIQDSSIFVTLQAIDNLVSVRNISHEKEDNVITLSWDPVIDEGFEGYDAFELEMEGWTQIDEDESPTYAISGSSFPNEGYTGSFIVFNPFYEGLLQADYDVMPYNGKYCLAAFACYGAYNNDWLISPAVTVESGDDISFMARSMTDSYGLESFRVLVSVQDSSDEEFTLISDGSEEVPVDWTSYVYSLDDYAGQKVKIAINYNSEDRFVLLLDDLRMGAAVDGVTETSGVSSSIAWRSTDKVKRSNSINLKKQVITYSEVLSVNSGLGYSVTVNDSDAGSSSGFSNSTFSMSSDTCGTNAFKVRTEYLDLDTFSVWSDEYDVTGCYTVTFVVTDEDSVLLEGATVEFDGQITTTNVQGLAVFDGVDLVTGVAYSVTLDGYATQAGSLSIDADTEMEVTLINDTTDTTTLTLDDDILIFPNPLIGDQTLQIQGVTAGDFRIKIYNARGQLLLSEVSQGGGIVTLEFPQSGNGIYVVELIRDDDVRRFKVVKL
jgi:M6 family metalloprotease-like protein